MPRRLLSRALAAAHSTNHSGYLWQKEQEAKALQVSPPGGGAPPTEPWATAVAKPKPPPARVSTKVRGKWLPPTSGSARRTDELSITVDMDDGPLKARVRCHVLGFSPEQCLLGFVRAGRRQFRVIPSAVMPRQTWKKLENTQAFRDKEPTGGISFEATDFAAGAYTRPAPSAASKSSAVEPVYLLTNKEKPFHGRTVNAQMRELLMERVFYTEHEQKRKAAADAKAKKTFRFHVRAPSSFERTQLPSGAQCHLYDCAGGFKQIEAADLGALLERCSMLPYRPPVVSFMGANQALEGLQTWLHSQDAASAAQLSDREGLALTLAAQGLRSKVLAPKGTRKRPLAAFVGCNGQEGVVKRWRDLKSCRCGLGSASLKLVGKRMSAVHPDCAKAAKRQKSESNA